MAEPAKRPAPPQGAKPVLKQEQPEEVKGGSPSQTTGRESGTKTNKSSFTKAGFKKAPDSDRASLSLTGLFDMEAARAAMDDEYERLSKIIKALLQALLMGTLDFNMLASLFHFLAPRTAVAVKMVLDPVIAGFDAEEQNVMRISQEMSAEHQQSAVANNSALQGLSSARLALVNAELDLVKGRRDQYGNALRSALAINEEARNLDNSITELFAHRAQRAFAWS